MPGNFVHLHLHTDHSLLRGTCRIRGNGTSRNDLASIALEQNFPALAVTDYFTFGGVPEFFSAMNSAGVKPIAGCEIMVRSEFDPRKDFPLVLLVRNRTGYRNLCRLLAGSDHRVIPLDSLAAYCEGLSALSGGPEGELSSAVFFGDPGNRTRTHPSETFLAGSGSSPENRSGIQHSAGRYAHTMVSARTLQPAHQP